MTRSANANARGLLAMKGYSRAAVVRAAILEYVMRSSLIEILGNIGVTEHVKKRGGP